MTSENAVSAPTALQNIFKYNIMYNIYVEEHYEYKILCLIVT